jgi:hypothetical protein
LVKALDAKDWPRAAHAAVDLREFLSQQGFDLAGAQIASGVLTASALHITSAVKGRDQAAFAETLRGNADHARAEGWLPSFLG